MDINYNSLSIVYNKIWPIIAEGQVIIDLR